MRSAAQRPRYLSLMLFSPLPSPSAPSRQVVLHLVELHLGRLQCPGLGCAKSRALSAPLPRFITRREDGNGNKNEIRRSLVGSPLLQCPLDIDVYGDVVAGPIHLLSDLDGLYLVCDVLRHDEAVQSPANAFLPALSAETVVGWAEGRKDEKRCGPSCTARPGPLL